MAGEELCAKVDKWISEVVDNADGLLTVTPRPAAPLPRSLSQTEVEIEVETGKKRVKKAVREAVMAEVEGKKGRVAEAGADSVVGVVLEGGAAYRLAAELVGGAELRGSTLAFHLDPALSSASPTDLHPQAALSLQPPPAELYINHNKVY